MTTRLEMKVYTSRAQRLLGAALRFYRPTALLNLIGDAQMSWVNRNFLAEGLEKRWKPRKPGQGDHPLLRRTGRMAQSLGKRVFADRVRLRFGAAYALYHDRGTRPYEIRARSGKFLRFRGRDGEWVFRRSVRHPGLPERPLFPTTGLAGTIAVDAVEAAYKTRVTDGRG